MMSLLQSALIVITLSIFNGCRLSEDEQDSDSDSAKPVSSAAYTKRYGEQLTALEQGLLKKQTLLKALCAVGTASCPGGWVAGCYSSLDTFGVDIDSFGAIAGSSVPVCFKGEEISETQPACAGQTLPVCGVVRNVSALIRNTQVRCKPIGEINGVICPFGGKPVCIETVNNVNTLKAYCVNNNNLIISTNNDRNPDSIRCRNITSNPICIPFSIPEESVKTPNSAQVQ